MGRFFTALKSLVRHSLDDEFFIARRFRASFGRRIDFLEPKTFNEKIQFQKLYNRSQRMTLLADKYLARKHIEKKGYGHILNSLIGVYEHPEDIEFFTLPNQFVIKCTHSWATNVICDDKNKIDEAKVTEDLKTWMNENHYFKLREWAYKNIKPKIIIEKYLGHDIKDYKFFCFSGKPMYIQIDSDRFGAHTLDIYTMEWEHLICQKGKKSKSEHPDAKPPFFPEMANIARDISSEFNFCRVDFLAKPDSFYFGEITFYPGGGFSPFDPTSFDDLFSEQFDVSEANIPIRSHLKIRSVYLLDKIGMV